ncbi:histidine kinase [Streptomyces sp. NBC_00237]|uniref:sensor histidine kinase n=1 Tax=Streptomyces sp. NBC_00237 TaxID=2975687 RepID=UPI0022560095|nr:histidine kinase [Streptomyces sp. NBC_00237]MCX5206928.1 histidine kinase [Streptomyces sp. NBC_00237]
MHGPEELTPRHGAQHATGVAADSEGPRNTTDSDGPGRADHATLAPRLASLILLAALLSYLGITALNIFGAGLGPLPTVTSILFLVTIFCLQLWHSRAGAAREPTLRKWLTLTLQALLTYLPILVFHSQWGAMAGFLAGSSILLLPTRLGWSLYGLIGLSMVLPPVIEGRPLLDSVYLCQSTLLAGVVVYGLSRLTALVRQLHDTKDELARLAVTRERLRISRNLHDLLGYSLSAITLKSELIHRIVLAYPERAKGEVAEVLALSRQSLADVRQVSRGLRDMSLKEELTSVTGLLKATDVQVTTTVRLEEMSQRVSTEMAAVLREAITNLLRHSQATHCTIEAVQSGGRVRLSVTNDGVDASYRDASPHRGAGLENLKARLHSISGSLTVARGGGETFELVAEAPAVSLAAVPSDGPSAERWKARRNSAA